MYPDPSSIAVASFTGQPNTVPSASGATTGNEGTPVVPAAPVSTPAPAPAPAPAPEPVIPQGSPVSSADLYAQQQAALAAANPQAASQLATPPAPAAPVAPPPAPAAQPTTQTVRDYARSLGFAGTEQYQDDGSFVQAMVQRQQQLAWQLQQMQAQAQPAAPAPAAPAAPAKPKLWDPPEWKPEWMSLLQRDTQGNVSVVPGADPAILGKYQAIQTYQRTFAQRFLENPQQMIGAMVEDRAKEIAETAVQQRLGQHTEQQQAQAYIAQNGGWLFAQDGQGRQVRNQATGQPMLSPAGQRFYSHLQQAAQLGIPAAAQQRYAEAQLRAELATAQLQAQAAQGTNQQQRQQVIDANRQPNLGGSTYGTQPGGAGQPQNASASLKDQLQFALQQAGVTNAHIQGEL